MPRTWSRLCATGCEERKPKDLFGRISCAFRTKLCESDWIWRMPFRLSCFRVNLKFGVRRRMETYEQLDLKVMRMKALKPDRAAKLISSVAGLLSLKLETICLPDVFVMLYCLTCCLTILPYDYLYQFSLCCQLNTCLTIHFHFCSFAEQFLERSTSFRMVIIKALSQLRDLSSTNSTEGTQAGGIAAGRQFQVFVAVFQCDN